MGWERAYAQARQASFEKNGTNPLSNPLFATVVKGALKGLKMVAMVTFAYELALATQMIERYVADKERELEEEKAMQPEIGFY